MDGAVALSLYPAVRTITSNAMSLTSRRVAAMALKVSDVSPPGAVAGADHGGSSKYSSENLEDQRG
jgi:hypothetical protein